MNKRKILALAMALSMVAILAVGATLAYFTDTDEAENVFALGGVKIEQNEYERVKDSDGKKTSELKAFTQGQMLHPAIYEEGGYNSNKVNLSVGNYTFGIRNFPNYVDKIVTVTNKGTSDAYVRTIIAKPLTNDDASDGNVSENWLHTNIVTGSDYGDPDGWFHGNPEWKMEYDRAGSENHYTINGVTINGKQYDLSVFTHIAKLAPNEETGPCFAGFYLDDDLNWDENGYFMTSKTSPEGKQYLDVEKTAIDTIGNDILVATQAVQAEGFADAWEAFELSFGEVTADNHPWTYDD